MQRDGDAIEAGRANAVPAGLVFLDLLVCDVDDLGQIGLREIGGETATLHIHSDKDIDLVKGAARHF